MSGNTINADKTDETNAAQREASQTARMGSRTIRIETNILGLFKHSNDKAPLTPKNSLGERKPEAISEEAELESISEESNTAEELDPGNRKQEIESFIDELNRGKFDPGLFIRGFLWFVSVFVRKSHDLLVQEAKLANALTKMSGENNEILLEDLAKALLPMNSETNEFGNALQVAFDLLSGNPDMRREFFAVELPQAILGDAQRFQLKGEPEVATKSAEELASIMNKLTVLQDFCKEKNINRLQEENVAIKTTLNNADFQKKIYQSIQLLFPSYISAQSDEEIMKFHSLVEKLLLYSACIADPAKDSFLATDLESHKALFQRSDSNEAQNKQVADFRHLIDKLKDLKTKIYQEYPECVQDENKYESRLVEEFASELKSDDSLVWGTLQWLHFSERGNLIAESLFPLLIDHPRRTPLKTLFDECIAEAALSKIETAEEGQYSPEQIDRLLSGAPMSSLLSKGKRREAIKVLNFIQQTTPLDKEKFHDFFNRHLSLPTGANYAPLLEVAENLTGDLKDLIRDEILSILIGEIGSGKKWKIKNILKRYTSTTIAQLCQKIDSDTLEKLKPIVKGIIMDRVKIYAKSHDSSLKASHHNSLLEDLQFSLRGCGIDNLSGNLDQKGTFGFSLMDILSELEISTDSFTKLPFKEMKSGEIYTPPNAPADSQTQNALQSEVAPSAPTDSRVQDISQAQGTPQSHDAPPAMDDSQAQETSQTLVNPQTQGNS